MVSVRSPYSLQNGQYYVAVIGYRLSSADNTIQCYCVTVICGDDGFSAFTTGTPPAPRYHHSAVVYGSSMFVFGEFRLLLHRV